MRRKKGWDWSYWLVMLTLSVMFLLALAAIFSVGSR